MLFYKSILNNVNTTFPRIYNLRFTKMFKFLFTVQTFQMLLMFSSVWIVFFPDTLRHLWRLVALSSVLWRQLLLGVQAGDHLQFAQIGVSPGMFKKLESFKDEKQEPSYKILHIQKINFVASANLLTQINCSIQKYLFEKVNMK